MTSHWDRRASGPHAVPTLAIFASPPLLALADRIGQRRIIAFHLWRIPAALLFFWFGARGELPPLFWLLAGTGDLLAGLLAGWTIRQPVSRAAALAFHRFGFADFIVAVGTGLTFTLLGDARMATVTVLPMALVVLFGVGISGTQPPGVVPAVASEIGGLRRLGPQAPDPILITGPPRLSRWGLGPQAPAAGGLYPAAASALRPRFTISLLSALTYALALATSVSVWAPVPRVVRPSSDRTTLTSAWASVPAVTAWTW